MAKKVIIAGVEYAPKYAPQGGYFGCRECAAKAESSLCRSLPNCWDRNERGFVWVEKEKQNA